MTIVHMHNLLANADVIISRLEMMIEFSEKDHAGSLSTEEVIMIRDTLSELMEFVKGREI